MKCQRGWRDRWLHRHLDAVSGGIELQAVIAALQRVARNRAARQRRGAVAAAILERGGFAAGAAIEHDILADDPARDRLALAALRAGLSA